MTLPPLSSETIHASTVSIDGRAVMIMGRSGSGKSDLALRLIDRGAFLVSDDYTLLQRDNDRLIATAPPTILGKIEVRGIGIVRMPPLAEAVVKLLITLDDPVGRLPDETIPTRRFAGIDVPVIAVAPFEASAPIKVELALREFGSGARHS